MSPSSTKKRLLDSKQLLSVYFKCNQHRDVEDTGKEKERKRKFKLTETDKNRVDKEG